MQTVQDGNAARERNAARGIWYGIAAYGAWGLFPVYWKTLHHVPALQLICHRIVWSSITLYLFLAIRGRLQTFSNSFKQPRTVLIYTAAALLIGLNWFTFVYGVNGGFVIETSLGYFINPLLSVLMGVVFLRERLRPGQWLPIVIALVGVIAITAAYGRVPWIALSLAVSFALYGMIKKLAPLGAVNGLTLETSLLFIPAGIYLLVCMKNGQAPYLSEGAVAGTRLVATGLVTTVPLLLFAASAQRIPLSMLGILQYIAPTLQFLLGTLVYREPFDHSKLQGFCLVWISLLLFGAEGVWRHHRRAK